MFKFPNRVQHIYISETFCKSVFTQASKSSPGVYFHRALLWKLRKSVGCAEAIYTTFTIISRAGVTNLFAIAGHFVSYRWVSGPNNFLVILWNLLKTKKIVHQQKQTTNESDKKFKTAGLAWMLRGPHEILLRA